MRKLLILMLVLGLTSVANATLYLDWGGDDTVSETTVATSTTVSISVNSDTVLDWAGYLVIYYPDLDEGSLSNGAKTAAAGDMASIAWDEYVSSPPAWYDYQGYFLVAAESPEPAVPMTTGTWFTADFHCDTEGTLVIVLEDAGTGNQLDSIIVHQIPEPMTIALLGLGGLLLRRRK